MNPRLGWALAAAALAAGYFGWGGPGVLLAFTVIVFWLLLQWGRAIRVMRAAGERPVGQVRSAVMLQARLAVGMTMLQVLPLTRSLGRQTGESPERWVWEDHSGDRVETDWNGARLTAWRLVRARGAEDPAPNGPTDFAGEGRAP